METLATPWTARSCKTADPAVNDARIAYNYYHSSARITIERTFGQLTRRFLVLKRPYLGRIESTAHASGLLLLLRVCVKLVCAASSGRAGDSTARLGSTSSELTVLRAPPSVAAQPCSGPRSVPEDDHACQ